MLGKVWKKILLFILIVACLFDVTIKLTKRNSFKNEIKATIQYLSNSSDSNSYVDDDNDSSYKNNKPATEKNETVIDTNKAVNNIIQNNENNINSAINVNNSSTSTKNENNFGKITINLNN